MPTFDLRWTPRPVNAPDSIRHWLIDRGSLTARLKARCPDFRVRRLSQGRATPCLDEAAAVDLRPGQRGLVREVLLHCDGRPAVFAHTVLNPADLSGPWRQVAGLGNRPLGEALFRNPRIARRPLAFRRLAAGDRLARRVRAATGASGAGLWARRSRFLLEGRPILVTEVFLAGMEARVPARPPR